MTAVANATFTAAQFNTHVRDNLSETAPAKATAAGRLFVSTGVNAIAEREFTSAAIAASESTTSATYTNLTTVGPDVTVTTGPRALALFTAGITNSVADAASLMSVEVSGATSITADDAWALCLRGPVSPSTQLAANFKLFTGLTPGSHTFRMKYRAGANTASFVVRELAVMAL